MSNFKTPTIYGPRAQEIQWLNCIVTSHGLICGCDKPFDHLQDILKNNHQAKCLFGQEDTTGEKDHKTTLEDTGFDEGDLERLFEEDGEEEEQR